MPDRSTLAKLLALALLIAAICNGTGTYLKRTGVWDHDAYRSYWGVHCGLMDPPREWQCDRFTTPAEIDRNSLPNTGTRVFDSSQYVYEVRAAERPLKLAKDFFWLLLLAVSAWALTRERPRLPALQDSWPIAGLAVYSMLALLASLSAHGAWVAAAGLRSFLFLAVALSGRWLLSHMTAFAAAVVVLLVVQVLLVPFELIRGIHLFGEWALFPLAGRVVGTLVQPNSLGVFAVASAAFGYSFLAGRAFWPLACVTLALVLLSGSGTGLVCAAAALLVQALRRIGAGKRLLVGVVGVAAAGALLGWLLPLLTGRPMVLESLTLGRLDRLHDALTGRPWLQVVFGGGLGVNTNLALNLAALPQAGAAGSSMAPTDSALIGLLIQVGVLGTFLFYATLAWAALRDSAARPFYAIVALCTLTMNVTELFPVNALLGVALAHSLWKPRVSGEGAASYGR